MGDQESLIGKIEGYRFPYLLSWLIRNSRTGKLILRKDIKRKILYFSEGNLSYSASSEEIDSIGHILIKRGYLTKTHLNEATIFSQEKGKTLGRSLIELGYIKPEVLVKMASLQLARNILSLFQWDRFLYIFKTSELPSRIIKLQINSYQLLFESIFRVKNEAWLDKLLGSLSVSLALAKDFLNSYKKLFFSEEVDLVLTKIDGMRSANTILHLMGVDKLRVKQILGGLKILGIIEELQSEESKG